MNKEQAKAMHQLQKLSFAMYETILFLDSHPDNSAAMRYYHDVAEAYETAKRAYEEKYGPISISGGTHNVHGDSWTWVDGPWPWEVDFPNNTNANGEV